MVVFGSVRQIRFVPEDGVTLSRSQRRRVLGDMVRQAGRPVVGRRAAVFRLDGQDYFLRDDREGLHASEYFNRKSASVPTSYVGGSGWAMPAGYRLVPKKGRALRTEKERILEEARQKGPIQTLVVVAERVGRRWKAVFQEGKNNGADSQVSPLPG